MSKRRKPSEQPNSQGAEVPENTQVQETEIVNIDAVAEGSEQPVIPVVIGSPTANDQADVVSNHDMPAQLETDGDIIQAVGNAAPVEQSPEMQQAIISAVRDCALEIHGESKSPVAAVPDFSAGQPVDEPIQADLLPTPELSEAARYLDEIRKSGSPAEITALLAIEAFSKAMTPKAPLSEEQGIAAQHALLTSLTRLLENDYLVFRQAWTVLLIYFLEHHGDQNSGKSYTAISEISTNRFLSGWRSGKAKSDAYRFLIAVLRATRDPKTRRAESKALQLDKLDAVLTSKAASNLRQFYSV